MNQSAIAMLQKTIEFMSKDSCTELMPEMIPPLLTVSKTRFSSLSLDPKKTIRHVLSMSLAKVWDFHSHNLAVGESVSA